MDEVAREDPLQRRAVSASVEPFVLEQLDLPLVFFGVLLRRLRRGNRRSGEPGEPGEKERKPRAGSHSFSTRCTNETAIDPSPTADATRLTLPPRTSPTANTPGQARLEQVRRPRERPLRRGQVLGRQVRPGLDEALRVERDAAVEPAACWAPRRSSRRRAGCRGVSALAASGCRASARARGARRLRAPRSRCACAARSRDSPRCGGSGSATCVSARPAERTSMCTRRAVCARNTAAWPAELPPPTTMTSSSPHSCASTNVAP